jgi:hypothetical protein
VERRRHIPCVLREEGKAQAGTDVAITDGARALQRAAAACNDAWIIGAGGRPLPWRDGLNTSWPLLSVSSVDANRHQ